MSTLLTGPRREQRERMEATPASDKQRSFIESLLVQRDTTGTAYEGWTPDWSRANVYSASKVITFLQSLPQRQTRDLLSWDNGSGETPEGMHKFGGVIFKVQVAVHGSGRKYAKALVEDGNGGWRFEYVAGAMKNLSERTKLTLEEAKAFGAVYGTCCVCGRTLTNEESIEAGIGPVCSGKF